jgi:hypothetical protein
MPSVSRTRRTRGLGESFKTKEEWYSLKNRFTGSCSNPEDLLKNRRRRFFVPFS